MSSLNSVFALDPARVRVKPHILVPLLSVTSARMEGHLHVDLLCFGIDDGSLSEARVWPTARREIGPSFTGCAALSVIDPQICEILVLPLPSEDEYQLPGRFEKHGMTWWRVSMLTRPHTGLDYQIGGVSLEMSPSLACQISANSYVRDTINPL